jgi:NADH dehydrogenase
MLPVVAAGVLFPGDIVRSIRRILGRVRFSKAEVQSVDLNTRHVRCTAEPARRDLTSEFDHLLLALGSETNFFEVPGVGDWAATIKRLMDAALLRNRLVAILEHASLHKDDDHRRR